MILVYGASGHGQEVAYWAKCCGHEVIGWIDDTVVGDRVYRLSEAIAKYPDTRIALGVGWPKVRKKLGSRFAEVESLATEFRNWADEQEESIRDWERKCEGCSHWIDGNDPADNQGIDSARDSDTWCGKYKVGERTITDPCPSYKDFRSVN